MAITALHKRKFKTNLAILFAIFAWCALLFVIAMVKMMPDAHATSIDAPNVSPAAVFGISTYYKTCSRSEDCVLVTTGCDGCCVQDAINSQYLSTYKSEKNKSCKQANNPVCGCKNPIVPTSCQNGQCVIFTPAAPNTPAPPAPTLAPNITPITP